MKNDIKVLGINGEWIVEPKVSRRKRYKKFFELFWAKDRGFPQNTPSYFVPNSFG